jgi:WD40 repeat protein
VVRRLDTAPARACELIGFSPDARFVAVCLRKLELGSDRDNKVQCWDVADGRLQLDRDTDSARFLRAVPWVGMWDRKNNGGGHLVSFWDYGSGRERGAIELESAQVSNELSPDGRVALDLRISALPGAYWLFQAGVSPTFWGSRYLRLLDTATGRPIGHVPLVAADDPWAYALTRVDTAFSPDGRCLAVLNEGQLEIWNFPPHRLPARFWLFVAILAAFLGLVARWRVRRLRAAGASSPA